MITLYHGSEYLFNKFLFKNVGKKSGISGAGFGLYFSNLKADALAYGPIVYTVNVELQKELSNDKLSLDYSMVRVLLQYFESITPVKFIEQFSSLKDALQLLMDSSTDTDLVGCIVSKTGCINEMMQTLVHYGYTHSMDNDTPEASDIINYVIYDLDCLTIVKREKPLDTLTESYIQEELEYIDLMECETRILCCNYPESLVSLSDNMQRDARTKTLSQGQGRAKSKSQRRLMAMALAYKKGKLPEKYASDTIKKLSKTIEQSTLKDFAKTKQKKRRKDGSIGKRNNIPERVKK